MAEPGTIIYNSPTNVQVADNDGILRRAQLVAAPSGDIRFHDPDNSPNVELLCPDGEYHRAMLVAMIGGGGGGGSIDEDRVIIKSDIIPTASSDTHTKMYIYSGETNSTYTHGYIYECVADATESVSIDLAQANPYEINRLAFDSDNYDLDDFFERIASLTTPTFNPADVATGTMVLDKLNELWSVSGYDADGNALFTNFTFDGTGSQTSLDAFGFVYLDRFPDNFPDGYTENYTVTRTPGFTNYRWVRIDVQPGGGHDKGIFETILDLESSYPTGDDGDYAYVKETSTYWIWDSTQSSWIDSLETRGVTSVNGMSGDVTLDASDVGAQEVLVSGTNIKTIDGNSILGSGNLELSTYLTYPSGWPTTSSSSTKDFCDAVALDTTATAGKAYLGEVEWSDLPGNLGNGEVVVEIISGTTSSNKIIILTLTSGNTSPYMWKYTYWNGGSNVSGWKGFVPTTTTGNQVYGTNSDGSQVTLTYDSGANANTIAQRDGNSQLNVNLTPTANNHATSKKYVDDGLSGKVDKTNTAYKIYGTSSNGSQAVLTYDSADNSNTIVIRDGNGQVYVAQIPVSDGHATSKSYVDTRVNAAITEAVVFKGIVPDETYLPTQESATISQTTGSSLSDLAVVASTFGTKVSGVSGTYSFVYDGTNWQLDGSDADLTQYGITYSGTPVGTDTIKVVYTAAPVNGDMYWITAFSSNPPTGMTEGLSGSAIYNGDLSEYQYTEDAIYQPDEHTIDFDGNGELSVKISAATGNTLETKSDGLYVGGETTVVENTSANDTLDLPHNTLINCNTNRTALPITFPSAVPTEYIAQLNFTIANSGVLPSAPSGQSWSPNTVYWMGDDTNAGVFTPLTGKRYSVLFYNDGLTVNSTGKEIRGIVQSTTIS